MRKGKKSEIAMKTFLNIPLIKNIDEFDDFLGKNTQN